MNYSKKLNGLESKLCNLYFVNSTQVQYKSYLWLKLSYSYYVKLFKIHYMVINFYCIHQSYKKRVAPTRDLSSGHPLQEANEGLHTTFT
jgi:hypothetical protein